MAGTLFVVATPIGNLEDITARALRVLREVSLIAAEDTRRTARLLAHYAIRTPTTSLHDHNERQKSARIIERLRQGEHIALVSDAGTPTISDPGHLVIRAAIDAGIRVEPVPGPSALLAVLAASGLPTEMFTFLGFPPTRATARNKWFDRLRSLTGTVVFFEAPHRIQTTLEDLQRSVGDLEVVVGRELTKVHEELVRGPISSVTERLAAPRGEFTVALSIGLSTNNNHLAELSSGQAAHEFGLLTNTNRLSRRQAISAIAKRHALSSRAVYAMLEAAKKSGE